MPGRFGNDLSLRSFEAFKQKILEIPAAAIGRKQSEIVDMEVSPKMRVPQFLTVDLVEPGTSA